jgi:uncharacterized protein (DUF4415 family)
MSRPKPHTYLPNLLDTPPTSRRATEGASMTRRGRPSSDRERVVIALRLDADLLDTIRAMAKRRGLGYQTYMHRLLKRGVAHEAIVEAELASWLIRDE